MSFLRNYKKRVSDDMDKNIEEEDTHFTSTELKEIDGIVKKFNKYETSSNRYKTNYVMSYDEKLYKMFRNKFPGKVKEIEDELIARKPWLKKRRDLLHFQTNRVIIPPVTLSNEQSTEKAPTRFVLSLDAISEQSFHGEFFHPTNHKELQEVFRAKNKILEKGIRFSAKLVENMDLETLFNSLLKILTSDEIEDIIDASSLDGRDLLCFIFRQDPVNISEEDYCMQYKISIEDLRETTNKIRLDLLKRYATDDAKSKIQCLNDTRKEENEWDF